MCDASTSSTLGQAHDTGCTIHRRPEVVAVSFLGDPRIKADAYPKDPDVVPPLAGADRLLDFDGGGRTLHWIRKRRCEAVPSCGEDVAAVGLDGAAQDVVVPGKCLVHGLRVLLPKGSAPLEVGEHEGDCSSRRIGHGAPRISWDRLPGGTRERPVTSGIGNHLDASWTSPAAARIDH